MTNAGVYERLGSIRCFGLGTSEGTLVEAIEAQSCDIIGKE